MRWQHKLLDKRARTKAEREREKIKWEEEGHVVFFELEAIGAMNFEEKWGASYS